MGLLLSVEVEQHVFYQMFSAHFKKTRFSVRLFHRKEEPFSGFGPLQIEAAAVVLTLNSNSIHFKAN